MTGELPRTLPCAELESIAEKVLSGQRLSPEDGLFLLECPYDEQVQQLADSVRKTKAGDTVYFATTLYIHPTNLCELSCPMCSYYAKPGMKKAWFMTPADIEKKVREQLKLTRFNEIHFVGGLWRDCDLAYYEEAFKRVKAIDPSLHIKALTPVEYDFLAKLHSIDVEEVLIQMKSWGLGSLPGGGAEILVEEIRKQVAPQKITSERYLDIHKTAHSLKLPSNITMLFGHVEMPEHIITHLCKVREVQDETGGFQTFIPLKYSPENNALGKRQARIKPKDVRRIYAVSRLMLDNIRNIKVLWNYVGVNLATEILKWGANDFSSTNTEEQIIKMAGGIETLMTREILIDLIKRCGRIPKEVHSAHDFSNYELSITPC